ncbi:MAG: hypothetical protein Q8868_12995 [Bacteroidota bacterium]|nr:hypothetical protein [Bacteroidota bacterium]
MPKTEEIINGLQRIVDNYSSYAIIWHAVFYLLLAALLLRWQPSNKLLSLAVCLPVISVAVFAWLTANPFNGILFSVLTMLIIMFSFGASNQPIQTSQLVYVVIGLMMIVFGLVYPHFVNSNSFLKFLYASPVGLIPCPTLSLIIGFLLLYNGFGSQSLTLTFIVFGLFYGLFGVLKLAVYLDIFLVFGTITLIVKYALALRT